MFTTHESKQKIALLILLLIILLSGAVLYSAREKTDETDNPAVVESESEDIQFEYPAELGTTFIEAVDWPPEVQIIEEAYSCTEAGEATARSGKTEERTVEGRTYCVTEVVEGAAGSVYTQYAYGIPQDGYTVILTFSTRAPQCGNYDEPQRSACERERSTFNPDAVIDQIVQTGQLPNQ